MFSFWQARGDVVVFDDGMGNAGFVSHQWIAKHHPDPDFKQMRVLQDALKHLLTSRGTVWLDFVTETFVPSAKVISCQDFQTKPLFIWYDYFSVPQLERREGFATDDEDGSNQGKAINSIPAYVGKCRYFFALCPTIDCPLQGGVLNALTWGRRGWCRVERASRELSEHNTWILIQGSDSLQLVGTVQSFVTGSVGEGEFTVESDRSKLAPVMETVVKRKLKLSLQARDFPSYRRHLNLQTVHLRGLDVEPLEDLVPNEPDGPNTAGADVVAHFLHQNGFRGAVQKDVAGWWPLHYAALSGKVKLIEGLLQQRANPNSRTSKDEPTLGFPPLVSALDLAIFYKHNDAAKLLIAAQAQLEGGISPAMLFASQANSAEGIRLLCDNGSEAILRNAVGLTSLEAAASYGARAAMEELVRNAQPGLLELSGALEAAMQHRGGSAEMVEFLVGMKADVDFQYTLRYDYVQFGRLRFLAKALQHRFGRASMLSEQAYHIHGLTPLMAALRSGQYEGAAALIAAGARLDLKNSRGFTAADFARGQSIPEFLQRGLEGNPSECHRVSSLAHPDGYVEVPF